MKILLVAVNAKYIHTCPAVYSLKAYAEKQTDRAEIRIGEYTINDRYQDVLSGILEETPDIIAFSTYIWNVDRVHRLLRDIRSIRGRQVMLWAGGPEATYYPDSFLKKEEADLCMTGEGEIVFSELVKIMPECFPLPEGFLTNLGKIPGLAFRKDDRMILTGMGKPADMNEIPFLYSDLSLFSNRIIYYESSRGCPFSCAYCLSGRERGIRFRNPETVEKELQFFLDEGVRQVKFVDRTFNADPRFAMRIWNYIREHDNAVTNFHFEIEADHLIKEEIELLSGLRPGLIQLEIGVQSANPATLKSVNRRPDLERIRTACNALAKNNNINLHLDLIAGLPFEDLESFRRSFAAVYRMRPHQFQVGFLKLLKGTELYDRREEYGLVCSADAPYEVLRTRWLSYEELHLLHRISDRVEEFMNTQGFPRSLLMAEDLFPDAFILFERLADYYRDHGYEENRPSVQKRYDIFRDFIREEAGKRDSLLTENKEYLLADQVSVRGDLANILEMIRFDQVLHTHPSRRMTAEETFAFSDQTIRIRVDYRKCSPVTGEAFWEFA